MRLLLQRVKEASVSVEGQMRASIGRGALLFLAIHREDTLEEVEWVASKAVALRCFEDAAGKMNLSIAEVDGALLLVSQFTLYASCDKGARPAFTEAAAPEQARALYEAFFTALKKRWPRVERGLFGAHMEVSLINDGPVTLWLERRQQTIIRE